VARGEGAFFFSAASRAVAALSSSCRVGPKRCSVRVAEGGAAGVASFFAGGLRYRCGGWRWGRTRNL